MRFRGLLREAGGRPVRLPSARPRGARHRRRREAGPRPAARRKILVTQGTGFNWPAPTICVSSRCRGRATWPMPLSGWGISWPATASSRGGALAFAQQRRGATGSSGGADRRRRPVPHRTRHHRRRCPAVALGVESRSPAAISERRGRFGIHRGRPRRLQHTGRLRQPFRRPGPDRAPAAGVAGSGTCIESVVAIDSGPNTGANTLLEFSRGPGQPNLLAGEQVRIFRQVDGQAPPPTASATTSAPGRCCYWRSRSPS